MRHAIYLLIFLAQFGVASAGQTRGGDDRNGFQWAHQVCSECHAVGAAEPISPNPRSPTFSDLATGLTPLALAVSLAKLHAGMPMFRLSSQQIDDIIAYMMTLRGAGEYQ